MQLGVLFVFVEPLSDARINLINRDSKNTNLSYAQCASHMRSLAFPLSEIFNINLVILHFIIDIMQLSNTTSHFRDYRN